MKFSIITVCKNSESCIRKTIESVLHQTYPEIEYIVIDGMSTDNTVRIAKEYCNKFLEKGYYYRIISEEDSGIYDAMNKGIRVSSGDLIGIINSGDWYEFDALELVADAYDKTQFDLFYADINLIKANGSIIIKHSRWDYFPSSRHWNHPSTFVKRQVYDEIGAFRCKGLCDDFDFVLRARRAGKNIMIKNQILANFPTGGVSNQKSWSKCKQRILDRYHCYVDNGYSSAYILECIAMEIAKLIIA